MFFNQFLPVFSIALTLLAICGGFVAFRQSYSKQSSEIQAQTIDALKIRVETLEGQATSDTKELARLRQLLVTIRHALKLRGLHIEIDGDVVTIIDAGGQSKSTQVPNVPKAVRPVKFVPIDKNDDDTAS